ncbi:MULTISPECIES: TcpD family membrane protein [Streptococcus anginosus group]|uniref:TcpD family membrane protein n=1 Tax=Streptococcus anginosus group TaxID=671232 RepID=UPI0006617005|nr:TcpD family membrane protein [Streptococcus constellatus]MDU3554873.1 TcpD family membrane protein [Streptococcus anginosus]
MKDLVTTFLKEQGVWVALGIGVGAGIYEFMKTKSFGKALTVLSAGFVIAFFCLYPEQVLAKFGEGMNWALSHIKF